MQGVRAVGSVLSFTNTTAISILTKTAASSPSPSSTATLTTSAIIISIKVRAITISKIHEQGVDSERSCANACTGNHDPLTTADEILIPTTL
jgi:hypothetical protein